MRSNAQRKISGGRTSVRKWIDQMIRYYPGKRTDMDEHLYDTVRGQIRAVTAVELSLAADRRAAYCSNEDWIQGVHDLAAQRARESVDLALAGARVKLEAQAAADAGRTFDRPEADPVELAWEAVGKATHVVLEKRPATPGIAMLVTGFNPVDAVVHGKFPPACIAAVMEGPGKLLDRPLYDCRADADMESRIQRDRVSAATEFVRHLFKEALVRPRRWTGHTTLYFHISHEFREQFEESYTALAAHAGVRLNHPDVPSRARISIWEYDELRRRADGGRPVKLASAITFVGITPRAKDRRDIERGLKQVELDAGVGYTTMRSTRLTMSFGAREERELLGLRTVCFGGDFCDVEVATADERHDLERLMYAQTHFCRQCISPDHPVHQCRRHEAEVRCVSCSGWGHVRKYCRKEDKRAWCGNCGGRHALGSQYCIKFSMSRDGGRRAGDA